MKISWLISWCVWIRSSLFGLKWLPKEKLKTEEQTDHGTSSFVENEFYIIWFSRFQDSIKIQVSATMSAKKWYISFEIRDRKKLFWFFFSNCVPSRLPLIECRKAQTFFTILKFRKKIHNLLIPCRFEKMVKLFF